MTREAIEELWARVDCLVLPADPAADGAERWSTILLDAMARGVIPVVMQGGVQESIVGAAGRIAGDDEALRGGAADPAGLSRRPGPAFRRGPTAGTRSLCGFGARRRDGPILERGPRRQGVKGQSGSGNATRFPSRAEM